MSDRLTKSLILERFVEDCEFPPALYDAIHTVNGAWNNKHDHVNYNERNRELLVSSLDEDLFSFLESRAISVLFEEFYDGGYSTYSFNSHSLTKVDEYGNTEVVDIDLDPGSFIHLMNCIMDFFNY